MEPDRLTQHYPPATRGKVVVWGYLASYPFGGMTWQALHYVVGLRNLGFDVWYVEDTDANVRDPQTLWESDDYAPNVEFLKQQMASVGLADRWVFRPPGSHDVCLGATGVGGLAGLYRDAEAVINLCGSHELRAEHDHIDCLVYMETDPVANQIAVANHDPAIIAELGRYKYLFTYGENIGADDCRLPAERFSWHTTRPPVIIDWWQSSAQVSADAPFSTVTSWTHSWNDVTWQNETWRWSKHYEFRELRSLPKLCDVPLELAVAGMHEDEAQQFRQAGWRIRSSSEILDPEIYREYIRASRGEFTVAKEQYVRPRTGWFSDRSVCYLAAGRPVVTQETGFSKFLPCGEGLLPFLTEQEAAVALATIAHDYDRHSAAATAIAREHFDAGNVLRRLMTTIGLL